MNSVRRSGVYKRLLSWKGLISYFITILIFFLLLTQIEISLLLQIFSRVNFLYIILAASASLLAQFGVAHVKWNWVIRGMGNFIPYYKILPIWIGSYSFKGLLPFKFGEVLRIYYLKKRHHLPWQKGLFPTVFNMFSDIIVLCLFSLVGLLSLPDVKFKTNTIFVYLLILLLVLTGIFWHKKDSLPVGLEKLNFRFSFSKFIEAWRNFTLGKRMVLYLYSAIFVLLEMGVYYFIFKSLKININPRIILAFFPVIILISLLPVTILGMGTRELALMTFFSAYATKEALFSAGIIVSFIGYLMPAILGLFFANYFLEELSYEIKK